MDDCGIHLSLENQSGQRKLPRSLKLAVVWDYQLNYQYIHERVCAVISYVERADEYISLTYTVLTSNPETSVYIYGAVIHSAVWARGRERETQP